MKSSFLAVSVSGGGVDPLLISRTGNNKKSLNKPQKPIFSQNFPFMILEIGCYFKLKKENWAEFLNEDEIITFHKNFMGHLLVLTVGNSQGAIHARRSDELRGYILLLITISNNRRDPS